MGNSTMNSLLRTQVLAKTTNSSDSSEGGGAGLAFILYGVYVFAQQGLSAAGAQLEFWEQGSHSTSDPMELGGKLL